jgi:hypothetical protein
MASLFRILQAYHVGFIQPITDPFDHVALSLSIGISSAMKP